MTKQLIILGNGFDLTAGLKSTYSDFFDWYFRDRSKDEINKIADLKGQDFNFWKELFWFRRKEFMPSGKNWSDVEATIAEIILNYDKFYFEDVALESEIKFCANALISKKKSLVKDREDISKEVDCVPYIFKEFYRNLRGFEEEFAKFLEEEVEKNEKYTDNANQLISYLITREFIKKEDFGNADDYYNRRNKFIDTQEVETQILSFNYTREFRNTFVNAKVFNNIHGSLKEKNIIFGIDGHNVIGKLSVLPFTKTYRIMSNRIERFALNSDLKYIKIFGHGLAEADYSYFQTIFDDVDLYSGSTELIFYINIYDENKKKEIIEEQYSNIVKLIQRYGETLDNKDHGKNMMHKLLLEGRLRVEELDSNDLRDIYDV